MNILIIYEKKYHIKCEHYDKRHSMNRDWDTYGYGPDQWLENTIILHRKCTLVSF